jgi:hypothetical protein
MSSPPVSSPPGRRGRAIVADVARSPEADALLLGIDRIPLPRPGQVENARDRGIMRTRLATDSKSDRTDLGAPSDGGDRDCGLDAARDE